MYSCHSILECYNLFSRVKLSIRSFYFISEVACWKFQILESKDLLGLKI